MLYTKAAALRILSPLATKIEAVRVLPHVIQVTYRTVHGRCSTFLSKTLFKVDFVEYRKAGAQPLIASEVVSGHWKVGNPVNKSVYDVFLGAKSIDCECEDYRQQLETMHKGVCKHGFKVLGELGFGSLAEYVAMGRAIA